MNANVEQGWLGFHVAPGEQVREDGSSIVPPGQRRLLHFAEWAYTRRAPFCQVCRNFHKTTARRGDANGGDLFAYRLEGVQRLVESVGMFYINEPVEARNLELGFGLEYDCPRS